jgi:phage shock protein PspC (stress-responsive transcriptional regulator)
MMKKKGWSARKTSRGGRTTADVPSSELRSRHQEETLGCAGKREPLAGVVGWSRPRAMPLAEGSSVVPLHRSRKHKMIAGVCGGIAEWLGWDPTILRIVYVLVSILSAAFPGIIVYVILWILMPKAPE